MALRPANSWQKRRREAEADADALKQCAVEIPENVDLDMTSEDEGEHSGAEHADTTDEEVDRFPELDAKSDTDDEQEMGQEDGQEDEDEVHDEADESDESEGTSDTLHIFPKAEVIQSDITGEPKKVYPEIEPDYDSDSSTEDNPNRAGNIPMHWYDDLPHVGYNISGKKILRPARGDELDKFLKTVEDPSSWTSGFDRSLQTDKRLTDEELDIIRRLYAGENPDAKYDPYEPTIEWFTGKGKEEIMPLSGAPEPKRRWIPSKWEKQKIMKIVRAIREGRILPRKPKVSRLEPQLYNLWSELTPNHQPALPAPKTRLPTNAESYNPPEEYLPTKEERKKWEETEQEYRERNFLPKKYSALRLVPAYDQFIQERFSRQLDLYLAPRVQRKKLNMNPEDLIPKLPSPSSLRPFPNYRSLRFTHNDTPIRCIAVSPDGVWAVTGDEMGVVCLWEVLVGREVKRWKFDSKIGALQWNPRTDVCFFIVGIEESLHMVIPPNLSGSIAAATRDLLAPANPPPAPDTPAQVKWVSNVPETKASSLPILTLQLPQSSALPKQLVWHKRGDYVASISGHDQGSVWIHQISRRRSQAPFKKIKGSVQLVLFHPSKPHFFVATQRYVRIYDLMEQKLLKALMPGLRWISSMDIHPMGEHLLVGGYDRKVCWFDLELSNKPYKVLRYHTRAIRSLAFHPSYPLCASSSDDGTIQVFHARVHNDLMTDPLIVPLKILRGHDVRNGLGVLQVCWTPGQPWLVSAGADGAACVWCH